MTAAGEARPPILGGELELLARNSAQFEQPNQSFLDQVVGTRGAGSDADDGRAGGNGKPSREGGLGLIGMRERAALHGGRLSAGPAPGGGFAVRVRLPTPDGPL